MKRFLAMFLAIALFFTAVPVSALADEGEEPVITEVTETQSTDTEATGETASAADEAVTETPAQESDSVTLKKVEDVTVSGGKAELQVKAVVTGSAAITYRWQQLDTSKEYKTDLDREAAWEDVADKTASTDTLELTGITTESFAAYEKLLYRCIVTAGTASAVSNEIKLLADPAWTASDAAADTTAAPAGTDSTDTTAADTSAAADTAEETAESAPAEEAGDEYDEPIEEEAPAAELPEHTVFPPEDEIQDGVTYFGSDYYVNTLFGYKPSAEELAALANPQADLEALASCPSFTSENAAGLYLRDQMVGRTSDKVVVSFRIKTKNTDVWPTIFNIAKAHTGNPKQGDYLASNIESWSYWVSWSKNGSTYSYTFQCTIELRTTGSDEAQIDRAVSSLLSTIDASTMTDYEKFDFVYSYMCKNISYDSNFDDPYVYSAYAGIIRKKCVCNGYALLFYRLMLALGVNTRIVISNSMNHAWNIVKLGDSWYHVDATWDASAIQAGWDYQYRLKCTGSWTSSHTLSDAYTSGDDLGYYSSSFTSAYPIASSDYSVTTVTSGDAQYIVTSEYAKLTKYTGTGTSFTVPFSVNGKDVRVIGENAFAGKTNLQEVRSAVVLWYIEKNAFSGCRSLKYIDISQMIIKISPDAFTGCTSLKTIAFYSSINKWEKVSSGVKFYTSYTLNTYGTPVSSVTNSGTSATVKWESSASATGYEIYRTIGTGNNDYVLIATVSKNATSYQDNTVVPGKWYTYCIKTLHNDAYGSAVATWYGLQKSVSIPLAKPVITAKKASASAITISWKKITGASYYYVYMDLGDGSGYTQIACALTNSITQTVSPSGTYKFYVKALSDNAVYSAASNTATVKLSFSKPTLSSVKKATGSSITVSWKAVSGATGYEIQYATSSKGPYSTITTVTGTSYTHTVSPNKTYYYRVRAVSTLGGKTVYSGWSGYKYAKMTFSTPKLTVTQAANSSSQTLSWSTVSGATGYEVWYRNNSTGAESTTTTSNNYCNISCSFSVSYSFKVRAVCSNSMGTVYSAWSNTVKRSLTLTAPTVTISQVSGTKNILLSWSSISYCTYYEVYRSTSKNGKYTLLGTTGSTSFMDSGLTKGKTYYYQVKAVRTGTVNDTAYTVRSSANKVSKKIG